MIHLKTAFLDILANQRPFERLEEAVRHRDGRYWYWRQVAYLFSTRTDSDRPTGISRDITERKRIEEALEKRIMALTQPIDTAEGIAFEDLFLTCLISSIFRICMPMRSALRPDYAPG